MNELLKRALSLKDELKANRRYLHQHAELGMHLPVTANFVEAKLQEMGYAPQRLGEYGIIAQAGKGHKGKTILLRADMDALPLLEESGLPFASLTQAAHCCGHDLHTTMLLAAAKLLKEQEGALRGTIRFLFQPGEETGEGAKAMIEAGVLQDPCPDAVVALHVNAKAPLNQLSYGIGRTFSSNDQIDIVVQGAGGHAARPHEAADPIQAANHICLALQTIRISNIMPMEPFILTVTAIQGGTGYNTIPDAVTIKATLRAYNEAIRIQGHKRIKEICSTTAQALGTTARVSFSAGIPPMDCSPDFTRELLGYAGEVLSAESIANQGEVKMGSEDFAFITSLYPDSSGYLFIGAGPDKATGYPYGQHSSKVVFNEDVLPYGAAVMAHCAVKWLENTEK
ncbi:M20 family metallopeptidase [Oscillospiraceae bacterium MB08-C2-2]|nr:M20 family metallopeptidase [Oscillospiraceae bacterium MB08-C2-2]